jgi:hypothetical protein
MAHRETGRLGVGRSRNGEAERDRSGGQAAKDYFLEVWIPSAIAGLGIP